MHLIALDKKFQPNRSIWGYESLIWTERYREPGDFELKTYRFDDVNEKLFLGTPVSLDDTEEVMIVETITYDKSDKGILTTVSGRSAEIITDWRQIVPPYGWSNADGSEKILQCQNMTPMDAVIYMLWDSVKSTVLIPASEQFKEVDVSSENFHPSTYAPKANRVEFKRGKSAYEHGMALVASLDFGFRTRRRQNYVTDQEKGLRIFVRDTLDRTGDIVLNEGLGHISPKQKRVQSIKGSETKVHVNARNESWFVSNRNGYTWRSDIPDGFQYRYGMLDVDKENEKSSFTVYETTMNYFNEAWAYLADKQIPDQYAFELTPSGLAVITSAVKQPAGLAFTVKTQLAGSQTLRVEEFVRVEDKEGERMYPTLVPYRKRTQI